MEGVLPHNVLTLSTNTWTHHRSDSLATVQCDCPTPQTGYRAVCLALQEYINAYADCLVRANGDAESQDGRRLVRWPRHCSPALCAFGCQSYVCSRASSEQSLPALQTASSARLLLSCRHGWCLRQGRSRCARPVSCAA